MVCMYSGSIWLVYFYICILFCCTNRNINENILSSFCLSKYLSSKRNFLPSMLVESAAKIKMTQSLVVFRKDSLCISSQSGLDYFFCDSDLIKKGYHF